MKTKLFLFFIFIVVAVVSIFVFLNPTRIPLFFTPTDKIELPVSIVILGSLIAGFILMLIISIYREIKMALDIRKFKKIVSSVEKSKDLIKQAFIELFNGNKKSTIKNINNAIKLHENPAYYILAKDIEDDENKKEEIINKLPYELSKFYLIEYYFNTGQYGTLISFFNEISEANDIKNPEILKLVRESFKKLEKYSEAIKIQEKILGFKNINKPEEADILAELTYLNIKSSNNIDKSNDFIKKFPKFRPAYFLKYSLIKNNNILEAIKTLREGYKQTNDTTFLCEIVNIAEKNSDEKVLKEAEKLISKARGEKAELLSSILYFLNNNIDKAESIVKKYLDSQKLSRLASLIYAEILYRKDMNLKEVIELFRKVLNTQEGITLKLYCTNCNTRLKDWIDYCPNCNSFNTVYSIFEKGEDNGF